MDRNDRADRGPFIGRSMPRFEDLRLVRGAGRYSDDISLPNQAYAVFVRSPHAHAVIDRIGVDAARAKPGVIAVLTGQDMIADGLNPQADSLWSAHPADVPLRVDGAPAASATFGPPRHALAVDKVRFAGEGVALVVAETLAEAKDAAEAISIEYAPLPVVTGTAQSVEAGAPLVWEEHGSNVCVDAELGDRAATEAAFAGAAHVAGHRAALDLADELGVPVYARNCRLELGDSHGDRDDDDQTDYG